MAGNVVLTTLARRDRRTVGWAYGGIGVGIAASGLLVAAVTSVGDWRAAWIASGLATAALIFVGWDLGPGAAPQRNDEHDPLRGGADGCLLPTDLLLLPRRRGLHHSRHLSGRCGGLHAGGALRRRRVDLGWAGRDPVSRPVDVDEPPRIQACAPHMRPAAPGTGQHTAGDLSILVGCGACGGPLRGHIRRHRHAHTGSRGGAGVPGGVATLTAAYSVGQVLGPLIVVPVLGGGYGPALVLGQPSCCWQRPAQRSSP
ncbi:hypothetical protein [Nesterenkonia pannonica]|uniref:hypothetical protein n=1 Tax=Nesterenkonia pannonica TaxID=1548602 RepID=UPI0021644C30|nr:hypothetical protein [Nesterenkonia pannonica]